MKFTGVRLNPANIFSILSIHAYMTVHVIYIRCYIEFRGEHDGKYKNDKISVLLLLLFVFFFIFFFTQNYLEGIDTYVRLYVRILYMLLSTKRSNVININSMSRNGYFVSTFEQKAHLALRLCIYGHIRT